ncbi:MAG: TfoX/Sxy family protein [Burkholderiales bacterium]
MANSAAFLDHLRELMRAGGRAVSARAMFGGHGLYVDGLFVAIVDDDVLYLRADDANRAEFASLGLPPFEYATKDGRRQAMSYLRAPDEALDSAQAMAPWVRSALGAALRAAASPASRQAGRGARASSKRGKPRGTERA